MTAAGGKKVVWGIDIASSAIKGVKVRLTEEGVPLIIDADIVPLEGSPSAQETPGRDRRIWQALQAFCERHDIGPEPIIAGLPGQHFFTRPFNVFVVGTRTESELVRYELEQHVPFGLDAVLWDYDTFPATGPSDREVDGLLFAMKKDILNNYLLSLSAADVEPEEVQAAPIALHNFVCHELQPVEPLLVVDIGAAGTTLLAIQGPRYWLRTIRVGGDALTDRLQRAFAPRDVKREDAEAIKLNLPSLSRRGEVMSALRPSLRIIVSELRTAIDHLKREHDVQFEKMILLGGGSHAYGLSRLISDELKIRVVTPAGLGHIEVGEEADPAYVNRNLPSLATPIGLALQGLGLGRSKVNVIGATLSRRRSQTMHRRVALVSLAALLLFTVILGGFSQWRGSVMLDRLAELEARTLQLTTRHRKYLALTRPGESDRLLDRFEAAGRRRDVWLTVLDKMARILPPENNSRQRSELEAKVWLIGLDMELPPKSDTATSRWRPARCCAMTDRISRTPNGRSGLRWRTTPGMSIETWRLCRLSAPRTWRFPAAPRPNDTTWSG